MILANISFFLGHLLLLKKGFNEKNFCIKKENIRQLKKPIGAITESKANHIKEKWNSLASVEIKTHLYHHGSHYAALGFVLYYMIRTKPFYELSLYFQGGRLDSPDRLMININTSWDIIKNMDVKEIVPEFYYFPEFLTNIHNVKFGITQDKKIVDDTVLPFWSHNDPRFFVKGLRKSLESSYVSRKIHKWINLIFGNLQKGKNAIENLNIFHYYSYEGGIDIDSITEQSKQVGAVDQVN